MSALNVAERLIIVVLYTVNAFSQFCKMDDVNKSMCTMV